MSKLFFLTLFILSAQISFSQSIDATFSKKKMKKDLSVFIEIREKANSGLYKYRTKQEIDSIYNWAFKKIEKSETYIDFYNIICTLTDFEGSLHNDTSFPNKFYKSLKNEKTGYFSIPIKLIENKLIVNIQNDSIPLGAEIISINNKTIKEVISNLYKYYTTDGINISGKSIGLNYNFSKYYRFYYGLQNSFDVTYKSHKSNKTQHIILQSTSYANYYKNIKNRYSKPFDEPNYKGWKEDEIYSYKSLDNETGILTINDFGLGNKKSSKHIRYVQFLDSVFSKIKTDNLKNLIVDVRYNGGGTDPNDLVTYSYLTQRTFSENKQAWISFNKIPLLRYIESKIPFFLRPLGVGKYNREFRQEFPVQKNGKYYQNSSSSDHKIRVPNEKAFNGNIFLLISPRVASAGSLFAAMAAGNINTTVIGEETMGGYYGHNGHTPMSYILPKSKTTISFSVVNLEQDVQKKENQIYNRGIIPDFEITQTYDDYLNQIDAQMEFVLDLIKSRKK